MNGNFDSVMAMFQPQGSVRPGLLSSRHGLHARDERTLLVISGVPSVEPPSTTMIS